MSILDMFKTQISPKSEMAATDNQYVLIVNLLGSKQYDPSGIAAVIDGKQVTYGDLKASKVEGAVRPNGTVGNHYPLIWRLNLEQVESIIAWLKSRPTARGGRTNFQPPKVAKPQPQAAAATPIQTADSGLDGRITVIEKALESLFELLVARESALPTPGHSKAPAPTEPVAPVPLALEPGQVVLWNGKLYELTVQANGRMGTRQA